MKLVEEANVLSQTGQYHAWDMLKGGRGKLGPMDCSKRVKIWALVKIPLQIDSWASYRVHFKSCIQIRARDVISCSIRFWSQIGKFGPNVAEMPALELFTLNINLGSGRSGLFRPKIPFNWGMM